MKAQSIWILRNRADLRIVTLLLDGTEYKYLSAANLLDTTNVIVDRPGVGPYVAKILVVDFVRPEHLYVDFEYKFVIGKIAYLSKEARERHDREVREIEDEDEDQELARLDAAFGAPDDAPGPDDTPAWTWVESKKRWARGPYAIMADILRTYDRGRTGANATDLVKDLFACVGEDVARAKFAPVWVETNEQPMWTWADNKPGRGYWQTDGWRVGKKSIQAYDADQAAGAGEVGRDLAIQDLFASVGEDVARAKFAPEPPAWTWNDASAQWCRGARTGTFFAVTIAALKQYDSINAPSYDPYDLGTAGALDDARLRELVLDLFSSVGEDVARAKFAPAPAPPAQDDTPTWAWVDGVLGARGYWESSDDRCVFVHDVAYASASPALSLGGTDDRTVCVVRELFACVGEDVARAKFTPDRV